MLAEETPGGATVWDLADNLGSVRDQMTSAGAIISGSHVSFDAFGKILSGTPATRFAFTAQEWDADAGLYYYNARWYDPKTGKFLSEHPIEFAAGDTNLTRMVGNSLTNAVDPTGMEAVTDVTVPDGYVDLGYVQFKRGPGARGSVYEEIDRSDVKYAYATKHLLRSFITITESVSVGGKVKVTIGGSVTGDAASGGEG